MSFLLNFTNSVDSNLKTQFVANYGNLSTGYTHIDALGNQTMNTRWPIFVIIVGIIFAVVTWLYSKPETDPQTGKSTERNGLQKFLLGLSWLFVFCSVFGFGYGLYLYFGVYLPEYFKWFESLPIDAKTKLGMITTIEKINSQEMVNLNKF
jgi:hypothetical protein